MGSYVLKEYQVDVWGQCWSSRKGEFLELCISRGGITEYGLNFWCVFINSWSIKKTIGLPMPD